MAKDILSQYGPGSKQPQRAGVSCGGVLPGETSDVMGYQPPYGPKNINDSKGPGLHGKNHGCTNGPDNPRTPNGIIGLNGVVRRKGSQGRY